MKKEMLEYYTDSIKKMYSVSMFLFRKDSSEIDLSEMAGQYEVPFSFDKSVTSFYSGHNLFDMNRMVSYYLSDDNIAFGCVSDMRSAYCIYVGPCLLSDLNEELISALMNRSNSPFVSDPDKYYEKVRSYLATLPRLSQESFMMLLQFTNAYVNNIELKVEDFHISSQSKKTFSLQSDKRSIRENIYSIDLTNRMKSSALALIRSGDVTRLRDYWSRLQSENPLFYTDESSSLDRMRQRKNSFIRFLSYIEDQIKNPSLSTRTLDEISLRYIEKAENIVSVQQLDQVCIDALCEYATLVRNRADEINTKNHLVKKAVEYIHDHVYDLLSADIIADALHISRGRLSSLFNKEMKLTLPEYIAREKIEVAKILLETTDTSLIDISNYLSFSSQSYFQNVFKKNTGMTPMRYRKVSGS